MNLAAALQDVDALLCGDYRVAIEIRSALLKLSEIFNCLESTLGAEKTLDVHAPESWCLNAVAELLRPNITDQMRGAIRAAIGMAVEAGHAHARLFGAAVFGLPPFYVPVLMRVGWFCDRTWGGRSVAESGPSSAANSAGVLYPIPLCNLS